MTVRRQSRAKAAAGTYIGEIMESPEWATFRNHTVPESRRLALLLLGDAFAAGASWARGEKRELAAKREPERLRDPVPASEIAARGETRKNPGPNHK